jgi:hypothetical protein
MNSSNAIPAVAQDIPWGCIVKTTKKAHNCPPINDYYLLDLPPGIEKIPNESWIFEVMKEIIHDLSDVGLELLLSEIESLAACRYGHETAELIMWSTLTDHGKIPFDW